MPHSIAFQSPRGQRIVLSRSDTSDLKASSSLPNMVRNVVSPIKQPFDVTYLFLGDVPDCSLAALRPGQNGCCFCRWYFHIYFLERNIVYFDCIFIEVCSWGINPQYGWVNGLALNHCLNQLWHCFRMPYGITRHPVRTMGYLNYSNIIWASWHLKS